jgi:hypothetical protein
MAGNAEQGLRVRVGAVRVVDVDDRERAGQDRGQRPRRGAGRGQQAHAARPAPARSGHQRGRRPVSHRPRAIRHLRCHGRMVAAGQRRGAAGQRRSAPGAGRRRSGQREQRRGQRTGRPRARVRGQRGPVREGPGRQLGRRPHVHPLRQVPLQGRRHARSGRRDQHVRLARRIRQHVLQQVRHHLRARQRLGSVLRIRRDRPQRVQRITVRIPWRTSHPYRPPLGAM